MVLLSHFRANTQILIMWLSKTHTSFHIQMPVGWISHTNTFVNKKSPQGKLYCVSVPFSHDPSYWAWQNSLRMRWNLIELKKDVQDITCLNTQQGVWLNVRAYCSVTKLVRLSHVWLRNVLYKGLTLQNWWHYEFCIIIVSRCVGLALCLFCDLFLCGCVDVCERNYINTMNVCMCVCLLCSSLLTLLCNNVSGSKCTPIPGSRAG